MAAVLLRPGSVRSEDLERTDPVKGSAISYTIGGWEDRAPMTIWMDGRPHPSKYAEHTRGGFTTGKWEGDTLVAYTTHMKAGFLRKNGAPSSDQATMTSRFFRHGDILTVLAVIEDPIYLAEPHIITKSFQLSAAPISPVGPPCVSAFEGRRTGRERSALRAREESVRRRVDEEVRAPSGRRARTAGDDVSGVSQDDQGHVRHATRLHSQLWACSQSMINW